MMSNQGLRELVEEIMSLGYDRALATEYAARIGDTPIISSDRKFIVVLGDHGREIARLKIPSLLRQFD